MISIEVENIKCGGCVNTIKKELSLFEGVESVFVDKESEKIEIQGNVERALVLQKLSILGYPEKGNNNLFKKAKSFVSCAVGRMDSHDDKRTEL